MSILGKYLEKIGVGNYSELSDQEKATYDQWSETLSKETRIDDIAEFMAMQVSSLRNELEIIIEKGSRSWFRKSEYDRKALLLTARIKNYQSLVDIIEKVELDKKRITEVIENLSKKSK